MSSLLTLAKDLEQKSKAQQLHTGEMLKAAFSEHEKSVRAELSASAKRISDAIRAHIRQRAQAILLQISQEKNLLYAKVGSYRAVASHLEQLERQLRSSMPQHVMDMLGQQAAHLSR